MASTSSRWIKELSDDDITALATYLSNPDGRIRQQFLLDQEAGLALLPATLKRPQSLASRLLTTLKPCKDKAVLCQHHRKLNAHLIRHIFIKLADECTFRMRHFNANRPSDPAIEEWRKRMVALNSIWTEKKAFREIFDVEKGDPHYKRVVSNCEACILATVGGSEQMVTDIYVATSSRRCARRYGEYRYPPLHRLCEAWLDSLGVLDDVFQETRHFTQNVRIERIKEQKKRRGIKDSEADGSANPTMLEEVRRQQSVKRSRALRTSLKQEGRGTGLPRPLRSEEPRARPQFEPAEHVLPRTASIIQEPSTTRPHQTPASKTRDEPSLAHATPEPSAAQGAWQSSGSPFAQSQQRPSSRSRPSQERLRSHLSRKASAITASSASASSWTDDPVDVDEADNISCEIIDFYSRRLTAVSTTNLGLGKKDSRASLHPMYQQNIDYDENTGRYQPITEEEELMEGIYMSPEQAEHVMRQQQDYTHGWSKQDADQNLEPVSPVSPIEDVDEMTRRNTAANRYSSSNYDRSRSPPSEQEDSGYGSPQQQATAERSRSKLARDIAEQRAQSYNRLVGKVPPPLRKPSNLRSLYQFDPDTVEDLTQPQARSRNTDTNTSHQGYQANEYSTPLQPQDGRGEVFFAAPPVPWTSGNRIREGSNGTVGTDWGELCKRAETVFGEVEPRSEGTKGGETGKLKKGGLMDVIRRKLRD